MIDLTAVLLAVIAAVPPTIIALASYRSSRQTRRQVTEQGKQVKQVEKVAHTTANKVDKLHGDTMRFMQDVAVKTAEFEAAQLRAEKRASGFGPLDP